MNAAMSKWMVATALCVVASALAGCGTVSRHVAKDGSGAESIVFPDAKAARPKDGTFPSLDNLRLIGSGMTKAQIQSLIGPPHFNEGVWGVREWDYLFNFRKDHEVVACQYKVLFDTDKIARSFYWSPASCAAMLEQAKPVVIAPSPMKPVRLSADALFDFNSSHLKPAGRDRLAELLQQLRSASQVQDLRVIGYTDRIGSDSYNLLLSRRRAEAASDYLIGHGISASDIKVEGRGKVDPVKECPDSESRKDLIACLAPNRRVEISGFAKP
ncbi:MAG: OmpA family protein [Rhodanobacter sp.]